MWTSTKCSLLSISPALSSSLDPLCSQSLQLEFSILRVLIELPSYHRSGNSFCCHLTHVTHCPQTDCPLPQVIDNLCIFRYSGELTVLMRTEVRYLDVWDLRLEMFPIIILRVTRTNGTYVHLIVMNYMFPMCERQAFYPNLMRRWRNAALNLRMTYKITQSNKIGDSGHRPSHASIMPLVFEGYPRLLYSHRLSELRNSNKRHQTSSFYVWALTSVYALGDLLLQEENSEGDIGNIQQRQQLRTAMWCLVCGNSITCPVVSRGYYMLILRGEN